MPLVPRIPAAHILLSEAPREYPSTISLALWAFDTRLPVEGLAWVTVFSVLLALLAGSAEHAVILLHDQREPQPLPIRLITNSDLLRFVAISLAPAPSSLLALPLPKAA